MFALANGKLISDTGRARLEKLAVKFTKALLRIKLELNRLHLLTET